MQFNKNWTFRDAIGLVPYLHMLGISHCYASPLLKAREGSPHGYDITDHRQLNLEIGSQEDFEHLAATLKAHGMGLILDIVPNHMGAGRENPWWMDVLENGPSSVYADYFDIDWHPLADDLQNKILLPILGDSYGKSLSSGELQLRFEWETGRFWLDYYQTAIPINPQSSPIILSHRLDVLEVRLGKNTPAFLEYRSIISAFEHLPVVHNHHNGQKEERTRERLATLNRLTTLCAQNAEVGLFIDENVHDFLPEKDDPTNLNRLHRLLEQQVYRLSNWRVASDEINYRRFFDINDLVALCVEDVRVFNDTHEFIFSQMEKGYITGLRIDHPDGLYDPGTYFRRLQEETARRLDQPINGSWQLGSDNLPLYVLAEKILAPFERLPQEWCIHGTTGYEFANAVNGLFVNSEQEREMTRVYERLLGKRIDFDDLVYQCKKLIMKTTLNSELGVLSHQLSQISKRNWSTRDYTLHNLRDALVEVVACFPVYRTYITPEQIGKKDREYVDWAIRLAKRRSQAIDNSIFDFVRSALLMESLPESLVRFSDNAVSSVRTEAETEEDLPYQEAVIRFAMKFQQYTGPVMAKGLEDTSFYRYNRLASLNEVGGDPRQYGISPITFHHQNMDRLKRMPYSLLATSTHDTKRSEDVRARISVLSEMTDEWHRHLSRWRRMNRQWRKLLEDDEYDMLSNAEYLFYQTLIGIWPLTPPDSKEMEVLAERMTQYMLKAAREAKTYTSWINPNTRYEEALTQFIRNVFRPARMFLDDFCPFQKTVSRYGLYNSLSQTLLKLTCPGVPDIYQGTDLWNFSLVDPDNRTSVSYDVRREMLASLLEIGRSGSPDVRRERLTDMMNEMTDGRIKMYLTAMVLRYRAAYPELFRQGSYIPLETAGVFADHIVAFARQWQDQTIIVVVPRLIYTMGHRKKGPPCGKRVWKDTVLAAPDFLGVGESLYNPLSGESVRLKWRERLEIDVADLLSLLPFGLLVSHTTNI